MSGREDVRGRPAGGTALGPGSWRGRLRPPARARRGALRRLAGLAVATVVAGCAGAPAAPRATVIDAPPPSFTLTDTHGAPYDFAAETAGRVTLLFFGYTTCPDVCPIHMGTIGRAVEALDAEDRARVRVVFVTVDPERDTPAVLRTWLDRFGSDFVGLRGSAEEVDAVLGSLHLPAVMRDGGDHGMLGHSVRVLAFAPGGDTTLLYSDDTLAEDLRHDLPLLLAEAG